MDEVVTEILRYTFPRLPTAIRRKVLVVEDDMQLARLYCTALAMRGCAPLRASDGIAALQLIEHNRPDLILLDLMLPAIDGTTVARELAANPHTSGIPIVVVTGMDNVPELPLNTLVLKKPCDPDHVARIVSDQLARSFTA